MDQKKKIIDNPEEIRKMNAEFFAALDQLEKEKHISKQLMLEKVEKALSDAVKKECGADSMVRVAINEETQEIKVYRQFEVVDEVENPAYQVAYADVKRKHKNGSLFEEEFKIGNLHRLSAQTAKQVIIQGVREAERAIISEAYKQRDNEIIAAKVMRVDNETGDIVVDTGTSNVRILKKDLIPNDVFVENQIVKVCIAPIEHSADAPRRIVRLTRSHPIFVRRLFELNVPEIADGTIEIKAISREPGNKCKVAVMSNDPAVDAIGSCIGEHRSRIINVLRELSGEQVELIRYNEDALKFIAESLSPAKVKDVYFVDDEEDPETMAKFLGKARVVVSQDQLSLAIGAQGVNAKLAAKLTNYKIDIKAADANGVY